ncbi:DUF805 domain-containing protein [Caulobacter sp. LjRoot300]|uniref:DUF805 domain-containing protein n=1 Tax=Caulobacter sp. LjRoot300 TaxID=3342321 RepID=UPI003ED10C90
MTLAQKLFSFKGRIRRRDYWLLSILLGVLVVVAYIVAAVVGVDVASDSNASMILQVVVTLALLWPSLALGAKRCHDRDQSAWWLLIEFIPIIGGFWALINLGILDGTQGRNRFGPSPKGIGGPADPELEKVFA